MNQSQTSSSHQGGSRPSPGLTLESLSFKNFPLNFKQKSKKSFVKDKSKGGNIVNYSKVKNNEEIQRNLNSYELNFEKNVHQPKKSSKQEIPFPQKTDLYYPKNYKDSNAEILGKILDSNCEFSPNSPSNLKVCQNEINELQKGNKLLNKINKEESKENYKQGSEKGNLNLGNKNLPINKSSNAENINQIYVDSLGQMLTLLDPVFEGLSIIEKIEKLLALTEDQRKSTRLGALVAIYIILKKYSAEITEEQKNVIIEKVISLLNSYEQQEENFLVACLEICTLYGPIDILLENIGLICMFITDFNFPRLQKATFNCLMSLDFEGIRTLVELASKDYQDYQSYILNNLIHTPHIQRIIIVGALFNELYSNSSQRRNKALAALSRMHDLVSESDTLERLEAFFDDPKINKEFIASILRTSGLEGENILLSEIKTNKDPRVRIAIANALSYRMPKFPSYLDIRLDRNDTYSVSNNLPGSFCVYYGKVSPFIENKNYSIEELLENSEYSNVSSNENTQLDTLKNNEEYLEVNTRDFLAALQRMLAKNYSHSNLQIVHNGNPNTLDNIDLKSSKSEIINKYIQFFDLSNINEGDQSQEDEINMNEKGSYFVSDEVIKALIKSLKDYSPKVRETAATSLGMLGMPEAIMSVVGLGEAINDEEVNVKSKVIWAIGRIVQGIHGGIVPYIMEGVKCNMWKVKKASLYTLGQLGDRCAKQALPYLEKLLKETPINKQLVAETVVKLGLEGESMLLKIMSQEPDSNYKLKSAIVKAFALTDINSINIDFIVEYIFRQGKNPNSIVREAAIFTINALADRAEEKVTYLKRKNVIPFYYDKLKDKNGTIQTYAINCIRRLGPQGELILIEGFTKDPNPIIRANCAIGLGENGVYNLRTLLIGLHDENNLVRCTVEKIIVSQMNIGEVIRFFSQEGTGNQLASLQISIKDIMDKNYPLNMFTINYFNQLLIEIGKVEPSLKNDNEKKEMERNLMEIQQEENYEVEQENNNQEEEEKEGDYKQ